MVHAQKLFFEKNKVEGIMHTFCFDHLFIIITLLTFHKMNLLCAILCKMENILNFPGYKLLKLYSNILLKITFRIYNWYNLMQHMSISNLKTPIQ